MSDRQEIVLEVSLELDKVKQQLAEMQREMQSAFARGGRAGGREEREQAKEKKREEAKHSREWDQENRRRQREVGRWKQQQFRDEQRSNRQVEREQQTRRRKELTAIKNDMRLRAREEDSHRLARARTEIASSQRPGFGARAGGFVKSAALVAGGGALGLLLGGAARNYAALQEFSSTALGARGVTDPHEMKSAIESNKRGRARLGFSLMDSARLAPASARATGVANPDELMSAMRARGLGEGEATDIFSAIRQGGADFNPVHGGSASEGLRGFEKLMAGAMATGLEQGRHGEFFKGAVQLMRQSMTQNPGHVGVGKATKMLTWLGLEGDRQGLEGFKGARGAATAETIEAGIRNPRGDMAKAWTLQALGMGRGKTHWQALKRMSDPGSEELFDVLKHVKRTGLGGEMGARMLHESLGYAPKLADALSNIKVDGTKEEFNAALSKKLAEHPQDAKAQALARKIPGGMYNEMRQKTRENEAIRRGVDVQDAVEAMQDMTGKIFDALVKLAKTLGPMIRDLGKAVERFATLFGKTKGEKAVGAVKKKILKQAATPLEEDAGSQLRAEAKTLEAQVRQAELEAEANKGPIQKSDIIAGGGTGSHYEVLAAQRAKIRAKKAGARWADALPGLRARLDPATGARLDALMGRDDGGRAFVEALGKKTALYGPDPGSADKVSDAIRILTDVLKGPQFQSKGTLPAQAHPTSN